MGSNHEYSHGAAAFSLCDGWKTGDFFIGEVRPDCHDFQGDSLRLFLLSPFQVKARSVNEPSVGEEGKPLPMEVSFIKICIGQ
jgi:hypothetical protein